MHRLIAIVLPEPVAIFIASRWRLGSPGLDRHPVLGELEQILQTAHRLDLGQVDERLDRLALAEVEAERAARPRSGARRRTRTRAAVARSPTRRGSPARAKRRRARGRR